MSEGKIREYFELYNLLNISRVCCNRQYNVCSLQLVKKSVLLNHAVLRNYIETALQKCIRSLLCVVDGYDQSCRIILFHLSLSNKLNKETFLVT